MIKSPLMLQLICNHLVKLDIVPLCHVPSHMNNKLADKINAVRLSDCNDPVPYE